MQLTIDIDTSDEKAQAFINFIKTLDFIKIDELNNIPFNLTKAQKNILDKRKKRHLDNESKSFNWMDIKTELISGSK
jgi:hypothetical protein